MRMFVTVIGDGESPNRQATLVFKRGIPTFAHHLSLSYLTSRYNIYSKYIIYLTNIKLGVRPNIYLKLPSNVFY
jgi:hypothetical protein